MLQIHEIVERLRGLPRQEFRKLIEETGIPSRTVRNIRGEVTRNPRIRTAQAISDWLERQ